MACTCFRAADDVCHQPTCTPDAPATLVALLGRWALQETIADLTTMRDRAEAELAAAAAGAVDPEGW